MFGSTFDLLKSSMKSRCIIVQNFSRKVVSCIPSCIKISFGRAHGQYVAPVGFRILPFVWPFSIPEASVVVKHITLHPFCIHGVVSSCKGVAYIVAMKPKKLFEQIWIQRHMLVCLIAHSFLLLLDQKVESLVLSLILLLLCQLSGWHLVKFASYMC